MNPQKTLALLQATGLNAAALLEPSDPGFVQPSPKQISQFFYYIGYEIDEIGQLLGLKDKNRARYWVKSFENGGKPIPGGYWDYLLLRFGFVQRINLPIKSNQRI